MRKRKLIGLLMLAILLLGGCGKEEEKDISPSPTPEHLEAPVIQGEGEAAEAAKAVMSAYAVEISVVAAGSPDNLTYAIPGNALNQFIRDVQASGAVPADGYYRFSWSRSFFVSVFPCLSVCLLPEGLCFSGILSNVN